MRGDYFTLLARFLHSVRLRRTSVEMTWIEVVETKRRFWYHVA